MKIHTRNRVLSALAALALTLSLLPGAALAEAGTLAGSGTAQDPYLIADAADLAAFRDQVNGEDSAPYHARLTADIALVGTWTPFGSLSGFPTTAYAGTFDGDGHTISGLLINATDSNQGLFGIINGATIQNLKVEGSVTSSGNNVGGIVGRIQQGSVVNCSFSGSVKTTKSGGYAGGIAGYPGNTTNQTATIRGCASTANVEGGYAGGIVGYAKYTTIENCYNTGNIAGATRAGGIAGQLQNNCSATSCYNSGTPSGSGTASGICGFLYSSSKLENCYSSIGSISSAGTGTVEKCETVTSTDGLVDKLGSAFATGSDGNLILTWQAGSAPVPKEPKLTVTGSTTLYDVNYGSKPSATLTTVFQDLDPSPVTWELVSGQGVVELVTPGNADANSTTISVQALKPGKATVKATVETDAVESGALSAEADVTVWPFVTTVEVATPMTVTMEDGSQVPVELTGAAAGQTARARIHVLGGEELDYDIFPVTIQWKYLTSEDYSAGNTSSSAYQTISGATGLTYDVPREREGDYLSFTFHYNGEDKIPSRPYEVRAAQKAAEEAAKLAQQEKTKKQLQEVLDGCAALHPVWGRDENAERMLEDYLADKGFEGYTATVTAVEEVYGGGGVADNGDLTYFYADPNTTPVLHSASYKVTLELEKEGHKQEKELTVVLPWDQDKVKAVLREEIGQKLTLDTTAAVSGDLSLPKVIDGKKWALISWTSSDPDVIAISSKNQATADTLFDPYVGVVKRGKADQAVTLTATVNFQLTDDNAPITLIYTYPLTVKALEPTQQERVKAELRAKLEAGLTKAGLTDTVTGQRLSADENGVYTVSHDVLLPTTRDFGVDGKYYPVTVTTDTEALVAPDVNNAARVEVYRPGAGRTDAAGTVTITLHDKDTTATASLVLPITVPALTQEEIDAELALMDRVKAAYFDGLRGENSARDNVRTDLTPFFEVYEENEQLVWVRSNAERTGRGIAPIPLEGWEELELWRLFKSSNPNVVSHENLLVTRQAEAKAVSVTSHLSSQNLGRYGQLYREDPVRYAQYAGLAPLYDQPVSTDLSTDPASLLSAAMSMTRSATASMVVRGTRDPESAVPVVQTIDDVTISLTGLDGQVWVEPQTRSGLSESGSVYDLFLDMLGEDYIATRVKGTYIKAISGPQGALTEKEYGENSGWMYRVNGQLPEIYMGAHPLHSGDVVQVFYTRDASKESPIWTRPSASPAPTAEPSTEPSSSPTAKPSASPSNQPSSKPSAEPSVKPSASPSAGPSVKPSADPSVKPSAKPSTVPSASPTVKPAIRPSSGSSAAKPGAAPSQAPDAAAPIRFADVAADAWYAAALDQVCQAGLMQGVSEERFAPELELSRGMLVCILYRMAVPKTQLNGAPFADVPPDAWYAKEAAWALQAGVVTGYSGAAFGGEDAITREQLAVMLFRYAKLDRRNTAGRDSLTEFADSGSISPWAREAMAWAVDSGILQGLPDGSLAPTATATRAQAAVMLARYLDTPR